MKKKYLLIYYIALILPLILYTSMASAPMMLRLGYLAALLVPLLFYRHYFPAVLICVLAISQNSFAYPLVPTDGNYYVYISAVFALFTLGVDKVSVPQKDRLSPFFVFVLLYLSLDGYILDNQIPLLSASFFICIMLYFCASRNLVLNARLISVVFIVFSLAMSYWIVFHPEARIMSAHGVEESTWADPNYLGGLIGTGCVVAVMGLLFPKKSIIQTSFCLLTIVGSLFFLAIMASRGAVLAVGVSSVALVLCSKTKKKVKFATIIGIVAVVLFMYYSEAFDILAARMSEGDVTGTGRTIIWMDKLSGFVEEGNVLNNLFGFGREGGFELGHYGRGWAFHNDFIAILVEYGLIGFIFYLLLLIYPFRIARKEDRPIILSLLLYIVTVGMTIEPIASGRFVYVAFLLYIIILAKSGVKSIQSL